MWFCRNIVNMIALLIQKPYSYKIGMVTQKNILHIPSNNYINKALKNALQIIYFIYVYIDIWVMSIYYINESKIFPYFLQFEPNIGSMESS